jgi:hypothetical protein
MSQEELTTLRSDLAALQGRLRAAGLDDSLPSSVKEEAPPVSEVPETAAAAVESKVCNGDPTV